MFTINDENIRYGFKLLSDPQETSRFFENIKNGNPNLYLLLFGDSQGNGGLLHSIGITQKTTEERVEEKKNFARILLFGLGTIASANANRSIAIKLPQPSEDPDFAYWMPDIDMKKVKELSDRTRNEDEALEICLDSQKKIREISPDLAKHLAAFTEIAYDNLSGISIAFIYVLVRIILLQTKESYEWRERTFKTM